MALLLTALALIPTCWAARYPRRTFTGIALGICVGFATLSVASFIQAFLGYVLPFGQFDYWLSSLVAAILG